MIVIFDLVNLIGNSNFQNSAKKTHFCTFILELLFWRFSFHFETEMKTYIINFFCLISYRKNTGEQDISPKIFTGPLHFQLPKQILFSWEIVWNLKMTQKCHLFWSYRTHILVQRSKNPPQGPIFSKSYWEIGQLLDSSPNFLEDTQTNFCIIF